MYVSADDFERIPTSKVSGGWLHCALRAGEQAARASATHPVATGQEGAASFVLSETAEAPRVPPRGVRDLAVSSPVIEFIIDLCY